MHNEQNEGWKDERNVLLKEMRFVYEQRDDKKEASQALQECV